VLVIQSLRPGLSGNADAPNAANYDEAKAGPFSQPPNPLVMNKREAGHFRKNMVGPASAPDCRSLQ
jgi:hypothetical protein